MDDQNKPVEETTDTAEAQAPVVDDAAETQGAEQAQTENPAQDENTEAQDDIPEPELNAEGSEETPVEESASENAEAPVEEAAQAEETSEVEEPAQEEAAPVEEVATEEAKTEDVAEEAEAVDPDAVPENPNAVNGKWYVIHTFAGHENRVATAIKQRVEAEHLEDFIFDVLVPTQDKIEIRGGKKETVKEKIFPGYILVKMILSDESWLAVRTTQGVTSFVGAGNKPTPVSNAEVNSIVKFTTQGAQPTFKDVFMVDDTVKIIDGPFSEFIGKVDSVDKEKGRVRVLVSIFGRETPVELDFLQVQKL